MDTAKRKALEAAGWKIGDAADFLELSPAERQLLDARMEFARAVRRQRLARGWSQKTLAEKLETSQPRVVKIEQGAADVSLDQLMRAFTTAGGKLVVSSEKSKAVVNLQVGAKRRSPASRGATSKR
jgi:ribosome-binding protein aMBF1 (putative translation factor)